MKDDRFGAEVELAEDVWVAAGVQLYGRIQVGAGSSLWPHVVIRSEAQQVRIGRYTNIQDFAMLHVGYGDPTWIGDYCSITHHATVHGARIEDACLVGVSATIMDGAVIGAGSIVAGGAMVREGSVLPPNSIVAGVPAKVIGERPNARPNRLNAWHYYRNATFYREGLHRAWDGDEYVEWLASVRADVEADRDLSEPPGARSKSEVP